MKKLLAFLFLSALALNLPAQTAVWFPLTQMTGTTNDTTITVKAVNNPVKWNHTISWFPSAGIQLRTTNGSATTNLIPNDYNITIAGIPGSWKISVNDTNVTLNAADIGDLTTYTFTDLFAYVRKIIGGTGITVTPSSGEGTVTLNVVGGGGSATNAFTTAVSGLGLLLNTDLAHLIYTLSLNANLQGFSQQSTNNFPLKALTLGQVQVGTNMGGTTVTTLPSGMLNVKVDGFTFQQFSNAMGKGAFGDFPLFEGQNLKDVDDPDQALANLNGVGIEEDLTDTATNFAMVDINGRAIKGHLGANLSWDASTHTVNATGTGGSGSFSGPGSAVADNFLSFNGTSGALGKDSGKNASSFAASGTTLTLNGTANQVTISGGAQDLSGNRTWSFSVSSSFVMPGTLNVTGNQTNQGFMNVHGNQTNYSSLFVPNGVIACSEFTAATGSPEIDFTVSALFEGDVTLDQGNPFALLRFDSADNIIPLADGLGFLTNNNAGGYGFYPGSLIPSFLQVTQAIDSESIAMDQFATPSEVTGVGVDSSTNAAVFHFRSGITITPTGTNGHYYVSASGGGGAGASALVNTNFYIRGTNALTLDFAKVQTFSLGVLTNGILIFSNAPSITNLATHEVQINLHEWTNGAGKILAFKNTSGNLTTNAPGWVQTTNANATDILFARLDGTYTNVIISAQTNVSTYPDTNSLLTGGGGGGGSFALISHASTNSSGNASGSITLNTTGAKLYVIGAFWTGGVTPTIADGGDTFQHVAQFATGGVGWSNQVFYVLSPAQVGSSITFSLQVASGGGFPSWNVAAYSDSGTGPTLDTFNGVNGTGANVTSINNPSLTPSGANELGIGSIFWNNTVTLNSVDSGFSIEENFGTAMALVDIVETTATAKSPTYSFSGNTDVNAGTLLFFAP